MITGEKEYDLFLWIQVFLYCTANSMADKGKTKLPAEETSSSSRRHRRDLPGAEVTPARPDTVSQPAMSLEEQEREDLFHAQLLSVLGTFEKLSKNPRMKKLLQSHKGDSQAESSQHAVERQREHVVEHVAEAPVMPTGPVQPTVPAQDQPPVNGQGSNAQQTLPAIPLIHAAQPGYFGGGSIFQAMTRQPTSFPGFVPRGSPGMLPTDALNPLYASLGALPGFHTSFSLVLMPQALMAAAGYVQPAQVLAARTGDVSAERAPKDQPYLMPPVYDQLTPLSSKQKDYKEGGQAVKFETFSGMQLAPLKWML